MKTENKTINWKGRGVMRLPSKWICIFCAALLIIAAGCKGSGGTESRSSSTDVSKGNDVSDMSPGNSSDASDPADSSNTSDPADESNPGNDNSDPGSIDDNRPNGGGDNPGVPDKYVSLRELAEKESAITAERTPVEYTVKAVVWNEPTGYTIVYPDGHEQLRQAANKLKAYFKNNGYTLSVVSDKSTKTAKEILIGDTNRRQSKLSEKQFAVTIDGSSLCFESGHFNGAVKAVLCFISQNFTKNNVNTLTGEYEFVSTVQRFDGTYSFVWGDEFDGNSLDTSKWELSTHMSADDSSFKITRDPKTISVADGNLKLTAQRWFDPDNNQIQAAAPYTIESKKHVNFQYGYFEMRARIPLQSGAWPSLWLSGACDSASGAVVSSLYPEGNISPADHSAEFDIVEYVTLTPNLHKWFLSGRHTSLGAVQTLVKSPLYLDSTQSYKYQVIGCEWTPEVLNVYINGEKLFSYDWDGDVQLDETKDMTDFHNPVFFRINNHLLPKNFPYDYSTLPCEYYIDYIRLYQKSGVGGLWLAE